MAKCIASRTIWKPNIIELDDTSFLVETSKVGENLLNIKIDDLKKNIFIIVNEYFRIKHSAKHEEDRWDCYVSQDGLTSKLDKLLTEIPSVIEHLKESNLISATKHRYFFHYSCGTIEKIKELLLAIGRLNDLSQKIYLEEQRKPLVSEESITIHALGAIWSACIEIINSFRQPAEEIFKEQLELDEYNFLKESDFWIAGVDYAKIFVSDLIITSWLQFNRLVRYSDLLKGSTFLCPCLGRNFLRAIQIITANSDEQEAGKFLLDLLSAVLDINSKPSMLTENVKDFNIIPSEPCFVGTNQSMLAYFLIWHSYSITKMIKPDFVPKQVFSNCDRLIYISFDMAMEQFKPRDKTSTNSVDFRLSPHQEERFKLIFVMIDKWLELKKENYNIKSKNLVELITKMLDFFEKNWLIYGEKYFDRPEFRLEGLTIFQLFTKLVYEVIPIKTDSSGHAATSQAKLNEEEQKLDEVWNKILDRNSKKLDINQQISGVQCKQPQNTNIAANSKSQ